MTEIDVKKGHCFLIGPIGMEGSEERRDADFLLKMVIEPALEPLGLKVKRGDADTRPGVITNHIIQDIFSAELVLADLTGLNANVFYELGIAHVAGRPTIPIAQQGTALPFDNKLQRTIFVDTRDAASIKAAQHGLASLTEEVKKPGFKDSNPVTQAIGAYHLNASGDPRDKVIADMQNQITQLDNRLATLQSFSSERSVSSLGLFSEPDYLDPNNVARGMPVVRSERMARLLRERAASRRTRWRDEPLPDDET